MADNDDTPTASELRELREGLQELRQAVTDLREARTTSEKREAQADVREAKADLDALAERSGISRAALDRAMAEAQKAQRKEEIRPILEELLDELVEADEGDGSTVSDDDDKGKSGDEDKGDTDDEKPKAKRERKPSPDTEPLKSHWSERGVGELIR